MNRSNAVIFDLFFTLINPLKPDFMQENEYSVLGMNRSSFEARYALNYELWACGHIQDPYRIFERALQDLAFPTERLRQAADARIKRIQKAIHGIDEKNIRLLKKLQATGYKTALISNADSIDLYHWQDSALSRCFDAVIFSCHVGLLKPDKRIYLLAAEKLQLSPEQCIFVGDGGHQELQGAHKAGMTTILTTEYTPWDKEIEILKTDADYVIERLEDLDKILVIS